MKQITLNIQDINYKFFIELIKKFDFVQIQTKQRQQDNKNEIIQNITAACKDLKKYKQGKLKTTPAKDFLNEL